MAQSRTVLRFVNGPDRENGKKIQCSACDARTVSRAKAFYRGVLKASLQRGLAEKSARFANSRPAFGSRLRWSFGRKALFTQGCLVLAISTLDPATMTTESSPPAVAAASAADAER